MAPIHLEDVAFEQALNSTAKQLLAYKKRSENDQEAAAIQPMAEIAADLELDHWLSEGGMTPDRYAEWLDHYLKPTTRFHNPRYLSHQVAVPDAPTALAELIHGVINNPLAIFEMGPSAATVEFAVINWMLRHVGWQPEPYEGADGMHGGGVFTHGGSLANLTALLAARAAAAPEAWEQGTPDDLFVMAAPAAHYSVARAISILGIGHRRLIPLPVDDRDVIDASKLGSTIRQAKQRGRVMCVVASACATGSGLHDPLRAIGEICRESNVWLHVDAAHGASALLSPKYRGLLDGLELADSTIWDAHKMLRTSGLSTAVLFRCARKMMSAMQQEANYIMYGNSMGGVDLIHRTVECTKAPMATKVLLNLAFRGESGVASYVQDRYDFAREAYQLLHSRAGFECPFPPESNILCFRFGTDDAQQISIREGLLKKGLFHLSSAVVAGKRYLRMSIMNPHTHADTIQQLILAIEEGHWRD